MGKRGKEEKQKYLFCFEDLVALHEEVRIDFIKDSKI